MIAERVGDRLGTSEQGRLGGHEVGRWASDRGRGELTGGLGSVNADNYLTGTRRGT